MKVLEVTDFTFTIVERFSDLDLTDAPTYESAAFSDIAHEIIIKFSSPAYVLEIGQEYATTCFSYFISSPTNKSSVFSVAVATLGPITVSVPIIRSTAFTNVTPAAA